MFKIIVGSEEDKKQLLEASRHIHDSRDIDTGLPMVNTISHVYLAPQLINVQEVDTIGPDGKEYSKIDIEKAVKVILTMIELNVSDDSTTGTSFTSLEKIPVAFREKLFRRVRYVAQNPNISPVEFFEGVFESDGVRYESLALAGRRHIAALLRTIQQILDIIPYV